MQEAHLLHQEELTMVATIKRKVAHTTLVAVETTASISRRGTERDF